MVEFKKKFTGLIAVIVSFRLILFSLNPRIEKLQFEFQTKSLHINTEAKYEIQSKKTTEVSNSQ